MNERRGVVLDTSVLVSAALRNGSAPHLALLKARMEATLLASEATLAEFRAVLMRDKFDGAVDRLLREHILREYEQLCTLVPVPAPIRACRDPRDDKFLEVAVHGRADLIVSGDLDLLALHPFHDVAIVTPAEYLGLA